MYVVELFKKVLGVNVALVDVVDTLPVTPPEIEMVETLRVDSFISSLKTTEMTVLIPTPVAFTTGVRLETVGAALSST